MANSKISALTSATTPLAGTETLPVVQSSTTKQVSVANLTAGRAVSAASLALTTTPLPVSSGGTGLTAVSSGYIPFGNSATALTTSGDLTFVSNNLEVYTNVTARNGAGNSAFRVRTVATDMQWTGISGSSNMSLIDNSTGFTLLNIGSTTDVTVNRGNVVQGTAAKGFNFTANTPAAGMTSQLLNWYEEGTWTPNQGSGLTVIGAFSSTGKYTRTGRQMTVNGTVTGATSVAVAAAGVITTNLPFTVVTAGHGNITNAALTSFAAIICTSTNVTSAGAIAATGTLTFSATYFV